MASVDYLMVSGACHGGIVSGHKVFFNSLMGSGVSLSGRIKSRMESLKTLVESS